jgi:hypothetical protein
MIVQYRGENFAILPQSTKESSVRAGRAVFGPAIVLGIPVLLWAVISLFI